jgi:hypothetical protein
LVSSAASINDCQAGLYGDRGHKIWQVGACTALYLSGALVSHHVNIALEPYMLGAVDFSNLT